MRLLLVEDETALACRVQESLEEARYTVDWARDGAEALALAREREYAAIILDLVLPRVDGWEVCETLRRRRDPTPILMLTAPAPWRTGSAGSTSARTTTCPSRSRYRS